MAEDKADTKSENTKGGKGRGMQIAIVAVLMAGEGVGVYLLTKALEAKPTSVLAGMSGLEAGVADGAENTELVEIELAECKPANNLLGKLVTYHLRVSALVPASEVERMQDLVKAKGARIRDRVNFVIRSADPRHLDEPGLETIKRRLKSELEQIIDEEGIIKEVLIPELLQSRSGV